MQSPMLQQNPDFGQSVEQQYLMQGLLQPQQNFLPVLIEQQDLLQQLWLLRILTGFNN